MHSYSEDFVGTVVTVIVLIAIIVACYAYGAVSCGNVGDQMKVKHTFRITTGCMIEHKPGEWIPLKNFRVM